MVPRSSTGSHERIVELAENMIRMTGKIPYEEIDIQFRGTDRQNDNSRTAPSGTQKLYEELFTDEEARTLRKIEKIFVSRPDQDGSARLEQLMSALAARWIA